MKDVYFVVRNGFNVMIFEEWHELAQTVSDELKTGADPKDYKIYTGNETHFPRAEMKVEFVRYG